MERYNEPFMPIMIAVTGFDDREMINEALRDRYIISYEPFNFKGDLSDFPLTLQYGLKVDAFRRRYRDYVWNAEFRDDQGAAVSAAGRPFSNFSTFRRSDGKLAVVLVNPDRQEITAAVSLGHAGATLEWASPEDSEPHPFGGSVRVPARSTVLIMER
jgi:hypothetical protein